MFAGQHGLDNLNLIVDNNKIAMLGYTNDIVSLGDLSGKLTGFGWEANEVDGHDVDAVCAALKAMKARHHDKPKALVAHTLKGRGVSGLENVPLSHIINPKPDQIDTLLAEQP